jgi:hypothetical protein
MAECMGSIGRCIHRIITMPRSVYLAFDAANAVIARSVAAALTGQGYSVVPSVGSSEVLVLLYGDATGDVDEPKPDLVTAARLELPILPVVIDDAQLTSSYKYFVAGVGAVRGSSNDPAAIADRVCVAVATTLQARDSQVETAPDFDRQRARRNLEQRHGFTRLVEVGSFEPTAIVWMAVSACGALVALIWTLVARLFPALTANTADSMALTPPLLGDALALLLAAWYALLQVPTAVALWTLAFWVFIAYRNLPSLGTGTPTYSAIGATLRIIVPYIPHWTSYWVWRDLLMRPEPLPPRLRTLTLTWIFGWIAFSLMNGVVLSEGGPTATAEPQLVPVMFGLWIIVAMSSIALVRAAGRAQRQAWSNARTRGTGAVASSIAADVLVAYTPDAVRAAQICVWQLERRGIRCWLRDRQETAALPSGLSALMLVWSRSGATASEMSQLPAAALVAGLPTLVVDTDGSAGDAAALDGVRWQHWGDAGALTDDDMDSLASALARHRPPTRPAQPDVAAQRATDVLAEPRFIAAKAPVQRAVLRYLTSGVHLFSALTAVVITFVCWSAVAAALERPPNGWTWLRLIDALRWACGGTSLLLFALWWLIFRRDARLLPPDVDRPSSPRATPAMAWLMLGVLTTAVIGAGHHAPALALEALSAISLIGLIGASQRLMLQREAWFSSVSADLLGTAQSRTRHGLERVTLLRWQSNALPIASSLATLFLIASVQTHEAIPQVFSHDLKTGVTVRAFPSPETDADQINEFVGEGLAAFVVAILIGLWVRGAWSNLATLRTVVELSASRASLMTVLPFSNVFGSRRVLSQLWLSASDAEVHQLSTPGLVRVWQATMLVAPVAWMTAIAMRHETNYWVPYAIAVAAMLVALWTFTYFAFMVRERQIEELVEQERQRYEARRARLAERLPRVDVSPGGAAS